MRWGSKKADMKDMQFTSKAEAFAYMLKYQLEERKADPMEAAQKASEFADLFASNMGMPVNVEPPKQGVDKVFEAIDKTVCYCEAHPQVVDFITGAATFAIGLFAGKKAGAPAPEIPKVEKIDFDKLD